MELKLNAPIPDFEQRMTKLVRAVEALMGTDDQEFKRQMMIAKNHAAMNEGNMIEIWFTSLRAFSSLEKGKADSVFK